MEFYCESCETAMCLDCTEAEHREHVTVPLRDVVEQHKAALKTQLDAIHSRWGLHGSVKLLDFILHIRCLGAEVFGPDLVFTIKHLFCAMAGISKLLLHLLLWLIYYRDTFYSLIWLLQQVILELCHWVPWKSSYKLSYIFYLFSSLDLDFKSHLLQISHTRKYQFPKLLFKKKKIPNQWTGFAQNVISPFPRWIFPPSFMVIQSVVVV